MHRSGLRRTRNSPDYAYNGKAADKGKSTAEYDRCAAAWYINDIAGLFGGASPVQAWHMHVGGTQGCGAKGYNRWNWGPSRAACVGCPHHLETCPSPPPPSLPPPSSPPFAPRPQTPPPSPLRPIGYETTGTYGNPCEHGAALDAANLMTESECRYYYDVFYAKIATPKAGRRLYSVVITDGITGASFHRIFVNDEEPFGVCIHFKSEVMPYIVGDVLWTNAQNIMNTYCDASSDEDVAVCYCEMAPASPPSPPSAPPSTPQPVSPPPSPTNPTQYGDPTTSCQNAEEALLKPMHETECRSFFHAHHNAAGENENPVVPDQHHFYRKFDSSLQLFGLCVLASANTPLIVVENEVMAPGDVLWTNHVFEDAPLCTTHVCHCMRQPPSSPPPDIAQDDDGADNVCLNEEACRAAVTALGYTPGMTTTPFVGQWTSKGCYAYDTGTYAGHAFFGTCGGTIVLDCTVEQLQTPVLENQKRIECYAPPSPPPSPPPPSPPPPSLEKEKST